MSDANPQPRLIGLLNYALRDISGELHDRLAAAGYPDIRLPHGTVFGCIRSEGSRLTELAAAARITKQAMGEATSDLERLGYLERVPDPTDRRAQSASMSSRIANPVCCACFPRSVRRRIRARRSVGSGTRSR